MLSGLAEPPDPTQIELDRKRKLLARAHIIREKTRRQGSNIDGKNPAKQYVWVKNDQITLTQYEGREYLICKDPKVLSPFKRTDGTHQRGDLILMEIDAEMYDALKSYDELLSIEAVSGYKDSFLNFAKREGIPTFSPDV